MSAYTDAEIVTRLEKAHHAGLIVRSPDRARIDALIADYTPRFYQRLLRHRAAVGPSGRMTRITRTWRGVWSPQLKNRRDVDVYLPDSYRGGSGHHPVVYVQDGQNPSDPGKAFAGTVGDRACARRACGPRSRSRLLSGSTTPGGGGFSNTVRIPIGAMAAATRICIWAFLVDTLKPRVDRFLHASGARRDGDFRLVDGRTCSACTASSAIRPSSAAPA